MINTYIYDTLIGKIGISENGAGITQLTFSEKNISTGTEQKETPLLAEAAKQLNEYLAGVRKHFDLTLIPEGTEFQKKVWQVLQTIAYGETLSYKQVAEAVGNPKACRAVGMANNKNPIAIFIPCHRVIGSSGKLVGYAGGLDLKVKLLETEKAFNKKQELI
ncbi:MAG: methylated-DNA--[protein]-cysteine S-methyltransferase [Anaerocolumna sp.]